MSHPALSALLGFLCIASPGSIHSCGSVILYRPRFVLKKSSFDSAGRFVYAVFSLHDVEFALACIYAPNQNPARGDSFNYVSDMIDPQVPTVLCGDFNAIFNCSLDRRGSDVLDVSRESFRALASLFSDCCVVDVWRQLHPGVFASTWMRPDGSVSSRIDLIGCPFSWLHCVSSCEILPCLYSDHSAVSFGCSIPLPLPRGPGRWKLKFSILKDGDFISSIDDFWKSWKLRKSSFPSLQAWWDRDKEHIKGLAVRHSSARNRDFLSS